MTDLKVSKDALIAAVTPTVAPTLRQSKAALVAGVTASDADLKVSKEALLAGVEADPDLRISKSVLIVAVTAGSQITGSQSGVGDLLRMTVIPTLTLPVGSRIRIYHNWPTEGAQDGDPVSIADETYPARSGRLYLAINQIGRPVRLAVRCETGSKTGMDTRIVPSGEHRFFWQLASDLGGEPFDWQGWGQPLLVGEVVDTNKLFWARARCTETEVWHQDISVDLWIVGTIGL